MGSKRVRVRPESELEIEEGFERYRQENPRIADRFLKEIGDSLKKIRFHPKLYPRYTKGTRRRILGSFPFSIIFQEKEEIMLAVAIAHAKRRPGFWEERLRQ